jgi:hypothetical protein
VLITVDDDGINGGEENIFFAACEASVVLLRSTADLRRDSVEEGADKRLIEENEI